MNFQIGYWGQNPPRCECHECTQARYKQSIQYQFDCAMRNSLPEPTRPQTDPPSKEH